MLYYRVARNHSIGYPHGRIQLDSHHVHDPPRTEHSSEYSHGSSSFGECAQGQAPGVSVHGIHGARGCGVCPHSVQFARRHCGSLYDESRGHLRLPTDLGGCVCLHCVALHLWDQQRDSACAGDAMAHGRDCGLCPVALRNTHSPLRGHPPRRRCYGHLECPSLLLCRPGPFAHPLLRLCGLECHQPNHSIQKDCGRQEGKRRNCTHHVFRR